MPQAVSTDLSITALRVRGATVRGAARVRYAWRRSLQLRVVITTLVLSALVVAVLGYVLLSRLTTGLLDAKQRSAVDEARAGIVEFQGKLRRRRRPATPARRQLARPADQPVRDAGRRRRSGSRSSPLRHPGHGHRRPTRSAAESNYVEASSVPTELRKAVAGGTGMALRVRHDPATWPA